MAQTGTGVAHMPGALDRGILRFWGVVTPVLRLWVGHKGSPLHTALVERHKLLVLGGLPPTDSVLEPELDTPQSQVKGWLAFTGVSFS